ncbi:uncharacterized protein MYCFIDRAFT_84738 [Pseudocercospora fijiensis CIRAD86]|uniref:Uncharacterized protein n=1 Tax=Pseudocercospora fijiensis (strain CIRAD86) TaxID=383855 RepID=M2ZD70_PSEFD|nr:uncharacterized protein MYCFIDRAFT_84738 [Pseudocercospora fijiensis CIRAD86]EME77069.1 hypothetical protein MYCFIDRAFT_84738 [Pseudocercospora fijiensis CIRAD86]
MSPRVYNHEAIGEYFRSGGNSKLIDTLTKLNKIYAIAFIDDPPEDGTREVQIKLLTNLLSSLMGPKYNNTVNVDYSEFRTKKDFIAAAANEYLEGKSKGKKKIVRFEPQEVADTRSQEEEEVQEQEQEQEYTSSADEDAEMADANIDDNDGSSSMISEAEAEQRKSAAALKKDLEKCAAKLNEVKAAERKQEQSAAELQIKLDSMQRRETQVLVREEQIMKQTTDLFTQQYDVSKREEEVAKREEDVTKREDGVLKRENNIAYKKLKEKEAALEGREDFLAKREDELEAREDIASGCTLQIYDFLLPVHVQARLKAVRDFGTEEKEKSMKREVQDLATAHREEMLKILRSAEDKLDKGFLIAAHKQTSALLKVIVGVLGQVDPDPAIPMTFVKPTRERIPVSFKA